MNYKKNVKRISKIFIVAIIFMALAVSCYAKTLTLRYGIDDTKNSAFSFETEEFITDADTDIYFSGFHDKLDGEEKPILHTQNIEGMIIRKEDGKTCSEQEYTQKDVEIDVDQEYCLITMSGEKYVALKVLELAEDWGSVTLEWELLEETVEIEEETEETIESEEADEEVPEEQSQETVLEKSSPPSINVIITYILIDLLILFVIVLTIIKIKKYS